MRKKKPLLKAMIFIAACLLSEMSSFAQVWNGSTSTTGEIYRPGFLATGSLCSSSYMGKSPLEVYTNDDDTTHWATVLWNGGSSGQGLRIKGGWHGDARPLLRIEPNSWKNPSDPDYPYNMEDVCLTVLSSGVVGMGTPMAFNPNGYTLGVNGLIGTKGVIIENGSTTWNWPDYVFDKSYKLRSLTEVKKYIEANKHLPDVTSEADIKKNGINVAETDEQLLKKVEELTLNTISLQEQNEKLEKRIANVEARTPGLNQSAGVFSGNDISGMILKLLGALGIIISGVMLYKRNRSISFAKTQD